MKLRRRVALGLLALLGGTTAVSRGDSATPLYTVTGLGSLSGGQASAINNNGQITGWGFVEKARAFLATGSSFLDLYSVSGGSASFGSGINNQGKVVGARTTIGGLTEAFVYDGTSMSKPAGLGLNISWAEGINDTDQIVGYIYTSGTDFHAYLCSNGLFTDLGTLGGPTSIAYDISNSGVVVGVADTAQGYSRGFRYSDGVMTPLHLPGGNGSDVHAINNSGQIAGSAQTADGAYHACIFDGNQIIDLGNLGGDSAGLFDINNHGDAVGVAYFPSDLNPYHPFVYRGGELIDLNNAIDPLSGWTLHFALGINDRGQIVGWGSNPSSSSNAFLLTPVPEPTALASVLFLGIVLLRRNNRGDAVRPPGPWVNR